MRLGVPLPAHDIKAHLDEKVIGQEDAKLLISVLLSVHINRDRQSPVYQRAPNAILVGPTGVGKTHTLRVAAEHLELPFLSVDTTLLVPSGARGYQVGDILMDLVREAHKVVQKKRESSDISEAGKSIEANDELDPFLFAGKGILFFDEFDKIAVSSEGDSEHSQWLRSVQRALLKIAEGARLGIGVSSDDSRETIDTSGILLLAGGAFEGILDSKIRSKRPQELQRDLSQAHYTGTVSADLIAYGFMPELVARLPVLIDFKPLTSEDLRQILDNPQVSPILVWASHFAKLGKTLELTDDAKQYLVDKAAMLKLGARGLHQVLFPGLAKLTYELETSDSKTLLIDSAILRKGLGY